MKEPGGNWATATLKRLQKFMTKNGHCVRVTTISQIIHKCALYGGPDWDAIAGREISHSSRPHRKKEAKMVPFGVQQLVAGSVHLK